MHGNPIQQRGAFSIRLLLLLVLAGLIALYILTLDRNGRRAVSETRDRERRQSCESRPGRAGAPPGKVLLVHSYHPGYEWVAGVSRGVRWALEGSNATLEVFYMDTKRKSDTAWKETAGKAALSTVDAWGPDVVIAVDDNAQFYFARHLIGKGKPRVVFCGLNADPTDYGYPAENVTGILERPHLEESLLLLKRILPGIRRVAVVTDASPTSAGALNFMKKQETGFEIISLSTPETFEQWRGRILDLQDKADAIVVYTYHTVRCDDGPGNMNPGKVMEWTVSASRLPLVGLFSFSMDDGMLCGAVASGVEHGFEAGRIATQLLDGASPRDFPMKSACKAMNTINLDAARKLGIKTPAEVIEEADIVIGDRNG